MKKIYLIFLTLSMLVFANANAHLAVTTNKGSGLAATHTSLAALDIAIINLLLPAVSYYMPCRSATSPAKTMRLSEANIHFTQFSGTV